MMYFFLFSLLFIFCTETNSPVAPESSFAVFECRIANEDPLASQLDSIDFYNRTMGMRWEIHTGFSFERVVSDMRVYPYDSVRVFYIDTVNGPSKCRIEKFDLSPFWPRIDTITDLEFSLYNPSISRKWTDSSLVISGGGDLWMAKLKFMYLK